MHSVRHMIAVVCIALAAGFGFGLAAAEMQPHMRAALRSLEGAKVQLERAAPDKGGHRVKAIQLVNDAITEVQAGITAADRK